MSRASFGPDYQDNLFAALFNLHKVTRHVLTPHGCDLHCARRGFPGLEQSRLPSHRRARGRRRQPARDRHRRLVQALLPNLATLEAGHARRPSTASAAQGAAKFADPRGLAIDWARSSPEDVAKLLADERPAVRREPCTSWPGAAPPRFPRSSSRAKINVVFGSHTRRVDARAHRHSRGPGCHPQGTRRP